MIIIVIVVFVRHLGTCIAPLCRGKKGPLTHRRSCNDHISIGGWLVMGEPVKIKMSEQWLGRPLGLVMTSLLAPVTRHKCFKNNTCLLLAPPLPSW